MLAYIPKCLCIILYTITLILGILCLSIPNITIHFLIPCVLQSINHNEHDGDKMMTTMERILTRLLGGVLVAHVMSIVTTFFMFFGKSSINPPPSNTFSHDNEIEYISSGSDDIQQKSLYRTILSSAIFLGASILLVTVFEMSFFDISACGKNNTLTTFVNSSIVSASFVVLGLLGIIISFSPNHDININDNSSQYYIQNISNTFLEKFCCCWIQNTGRLRMRWQLPRYNKEVNLDNDNDHNQISPIALLSDDHLQHDAYNYDMSLDQRHDEWDDEPVASEAMSIEQNQSQVESRISGTKRLLKLAGPHSFYLFVGCLVLLVRLPCSLSIPHFVSVSLSALARSEYDEAKMNILFLFIFGTIDAVLDFFCIFLFGLANLKISKGLRIDLFIAMLHQEMGFFDEHKSGDLASRLNSDCGEMSSDLTWFFRFSIESTVRIFGIVLYMFLRAPKLAAVAISVVPAVAIVNKKYGNWLNKNAQDVQTALAEANSVAQETLLNIRCVIAFASEQIEEKKYHKKIDNHYNLNVKQLYATGFYYMAISTFLINTCVQALLLLVGMKLMKIEELPPDVLLAFMLYQSQLQSEVMNFFNSYTSLIKSSGAGSKVFELLDRVVPPPGTGYLDLNNENEQISLGDIRLDEVSFSYPSRPSERVIRDLSLTIPAGKTVALIGKSGCGKSTIFSLIQRFYDPSSGEIHVSKDGRSNLKELNILNYRKLIGIVTQDPILFSGTIKSNIGYRMSEETTDDDIMKAAKLANAHEFIDKFPHKYETQVGERGVQLSGGQKQRICIARAIISKPKLLLLDEATSALDVESEQKVQEALENLLEERRDMTTLIIAHRLQTIRNVDKVVLLDGGEIVDEGSYEEVIKKKESYYNKIMISK